MARRWKWKKNDMKLVMVMGLLRLHCFFWNLWCGCVLFYSLESWYLWEVVDCFSSICHTGKGHKEKVKKERHKSFFNTFGLKNEQTYVPIVVHDMFLIEVWNCIMKRGVVAMFQTSTSIMLASCPNYTKGDLTSLAPWIAIFHVGRY